MIDAMTLAEVADVFDYWDSNPPAHLMLQAIARAIGWKSAAAPAPTAAEVGAAAPPGLAVAAAGDIGMPAPVLDVDAMRARNRAHMANRERTM